MRDGSASWRHDFGIDDARYPGFIDSASALHMDAAQSHGLRNAFELLSLDGILCSEQAPLIYFKQVGAIASDQGLGIHRKFWNHGTAPILVLIGPDEVYVYSGMARPQPIENGSSRPRCLIDVLNRATESLQRFVVSVETGAYFQKHAESFNTARRVDRDLLTNLSNTREVLRECQTAGIVHDQLDALLCRVVFACYLFDRKVIGKTYLADLEIPGCTHLRDVLAIRPWATARGALYKLFRELGADFNGDLFSDDLTNEEQFIDEAHIETLHDFFQGTDVRGRQARFWPYDFGYIPIETISAIYEHFLKGEESRDGAVYTPRLLAEIVLDTALDRTPRLIGKTFLDPACGSGIFLVGLFNRLAAEWTQEHPGASNQRRAEGLMRLLRESLFGVDKSRVACRITAFSLYLAYLDQLSPRDIQGLQQNGPPLPYLVDESASDDDRASPASRNIVCADFFSPTLRLQEPFDFIVGNPPWGSLKSDATLPILWCADNERPIPDRQIAVAFVWKAAEHTKTDAPVCFVLPHGTLFNHGPMALRFQTLWFRSHRIEHVLNLADLRFFLFREARHPALVVRYRKGPPDFHVDMVEYQVPKVSWTTAKADIITLSPGDRVAIASHEVLDDLEKRDAPQLWIRHSRGTPRDRRLLDRLGALPRLRDHVRAPSEIAPSKRWVRAEGFQPLGENDDAGQAKLLELPGLRFIDAKSRAIDLFLQPQSCENLPSNVVTVRQRSNAYTRIYRAPHVLITKGFKRIAFADFDVSFRHAVRGIHGPLQDRKLLVFLACYLRTDLARYFAFHTSSNWGVYRPEVHVGELLRLPFPLPEQLDEPDDGRRIVDAVTELMDAAYAEAEREFLNRANAITRASAKVQRLVNEYFNIQPSEEQLVSDTVDIVVPSVQPRPNQVGVPSLTSCTNAQGMAYIERLCATLNQWAKPSGYAVRGSCTMSGTLGVGVALLEKVRREGAGGRTSRPPYEIVQILRRVRDEVSAKRSTVNPLRGVTVFDENRLYILKPATRNHWTETEALNDADGLAATLLSNTPLVGT